MSEKRDSANFVSLAVQAAFLTIILLVVLDRAHQRLEARLDAICAAVECVQDD